MTLKANGVDSVKNDLLLYRKGVNSVKHSLLVYSKDVDAVVLGMEDIKNIKTLGIIHETDVYTGGFISAKASNTKIILDVGKSIVKVPFDIRVNKEVHDVYMQACLMGKFEPATSAQLHDKFWIERFVNEFAKFSYGSSSYDIAFPEFNLEIIGKPISHLHLWNEEENVFEYCYSYIDYGYIADITSLRNSNDDCSELYSKYVDLHKAQLDLFESLWYNITELDINGKSFGKGTIVV